MSLLLAFLLYASALPTLGQTSPKDSSSSAVTRIQWIPQPGVRRYRLQIASDQRFNDVKFDGLVKGREYIPRDLKPGRYYWRITSVESPDGNFLESGELEVRPPSSGGAHGPGWVATTGVVLAAITAHLQTGRDLDFLATNSAGTVYAFDSARGTALWTSRYALPAKSANSKVRQFEPLVLEAANNKTLVIVRFEKGLRALEGLTGKEVWQVEVPDGIVGGVTANLDDKLGSEIYLTDDVTNKLLRLNAQTGRIENEIKLSSRPLGPPVLLSTKSFRGLLVPLQENMIDVHSSDGKHVHSIRLHGDLTTAPVTVETSRGTLMMVGTKDGLIIFDTNGFKPLGRVSIDGGHPAGSLAIVDLNGDKSSDQVVLITNLGRIVAVRLSDVRIIWFADGFSPAGTMAFVDLNADGSLDVVVPDSKNFAVALSGNSGERIWEGPDAGFLSPRSQAPVKKLAAASLKDGRIIVVGNDPSASGLMALELMKGLPPAVN